MTVVPQTQPVSLAAGFSVRTKAKWGPWDKGGGGGVFNITPRDVVAVWQVTQKDNKHNNILS